MREKWPKLMSNRPKMVSKRPKMMSKRPKMMLKLPHVAVVVWRVRAALAVLERRICIQGARCQIHGGDTTVPYRFPDEHLCSCERERESLPPSQNRPKRSYLESPGSDCALKVNSVVRRRHGGEPPLFPPRARFTALQYRIPCTTPCNAG